ncbi:MAG TPA: hypothetical protein DIC51_06450 [Coxiellaceae bacterium]|nr:hypothetical protein [Coxiellaceae bacterium]
MMVQERLNRIEERSLPTVIARRSRSNPEPKLDPMVKPWNDEELDFTARHYLIVGRRMTVSEVIVWYGVYW